MFCKSKLKCTILCTLRMSPTLSVCINLEAVTSCLNISIDLIDVLIENDQLHTNIDAKVHAISLRTGDEIFDEFNQVFHNHRLVTLD